MNSGKMRSIQGSKIAPVIEETNYYFLNEIYKDEFDREISKFLESLEPSEDDTEFSEEEIENFEAAGVYIEIPEIYARISVEGESLEQTSDISSGDACAVGSILTAESEKEPHFCFDDLSGHRELFIKAQKLHDYKEMELRNGERVKCESNDLEESELDNTNHRIEPGDGDIGDCKEEDVVVSGIAEQHGLEKSKLAIGDGSHTSKGHSFVSENGGGGNAADTVAYFEIEKSQEESELSTDVTSPHHIIFSIVADDAERGDDDDEETDESGSDELEEKNISYESQTIEQVLEDESTSEQNRSVVADDQGSESSNVSHGNRSEQDGFGTDDEDDDKSNKSNGGEDDRTEGRNAEQSKLAAAEEWPENKEPEISSGYENPDSRLKLTEEEKVRDGRFIEYQGFWNSNFIDLSEDSYSEDDQTSERDQTEHKDVSDGTIFAAICTQNGMITSSEGARCNPSPKLSNKHKARRRSVKWKKDIEMEVLRLFNPRAPRFLPVEPNPVDEMVDLRHQQRDERKSSETWMIDNALQKAVRKLTPARSKKVALLVEAFETVMSVPVHELTLKSPTSDLGRPVQA